VNLPEQRSKTDERWNHNGNGEFGRGKDICNGQKCSSVFIRAAVLQMAMLFSTSSIPMNRAALTAIVMAPNRKSTKRPARSRFRGIFRVRMIGRGRMNTIRISDEATDYRRLFILSTSEIMFKDQLSLTKVIAVKAVHSPTSIDLENAHQSPFHVYAGDAYQLTAGSGPHQKVSPKNVVKADNTTK
jgi:hypothetical protein